jgi:hypothetical protein
MDGSDHRNHTVLAGVRRVRDINYKAEFYDRRTVSDIQASA